jgi:hypothetical protein
VVILCYSRNPAEIFSRLINTCFHGKASLFNDLSPQIVFENAKQKKARRLSGLFGQSI